MRARVKLMTDACADGVIEVRNDDGMVLDCGHGEKANDEVPSEEVLVSQDFTS